jgi:hypothetical protein
VNLTSSDFTFSDSDKYLMAHKTYSNDMNNDILTEHNIITFTDYSASSVLDGQKDKARIYLYRIEAFFHGVQLPWTTTMTRGLQNTIKVTMPPANMALVHRLMANKHQCQILGLIPGVTDYKEQIITDWDVDKHYSCPFSGLTARSLGVPWLTTDTVYDQGGDLLVDRFELGCNFTRPTDTNPGCYKPGDDPAGNLTSESLNTYHQFKQGDCLYNDMLSLHEGSSCNPATPTTTYT